MINSDTRIIFETSGNKDKYRKWQIKYLEFNFDNDGFRERKDVSETMYGKKYGSPFDCYRTAKQLLRDYNDYKDAKVIIQEVDFR